jgi:hypothetical protein
VKNKNNVKSNARVKNKKQQNKIKKCKSKNNICYKRKSNGTLNLNYCIDWIRTRTLIFVH